MHHRNTSTDISFEALLQELPENIEQIAQETKAFQRSRQVRNPSELMRLVLMYCGLGDSFRSCSSYFALVYGRQISDTAIRNRLIASKKFVQQILKETIRSMIPPPTFPHSTFERIRIIDGTYLKAVAAKGITYRGHISLDLGSAQVDELMLTDNKTGESLKYFQVQPGDLLIGDRAYFHHSGISHVVRCGGHVLVRYNRKTIRTMTWDSKALNVLQKIKETQKNGTGTFKIKLTGADGQKGVKGYIHFNKLPKEKADEQKEKYLKEARHKRRDPNPEELELREWLIVFSSALCSQLPRGICLELYRLRWQVEMAIKRFKSVLEVGKLPTKLGSPISEVYLAGRFLYAMLLMKAAGETLQEEQHTRQKAPQQGLWRCLKMYKTLFAQMIYEPWKWTIENRKLAVKMMFERKRKRKASQMSKKCKTILARAVIA